MERKIWRLEKHNAELLARLKIARLAAKDEAEPVEVENFDDLGGLVSRFAAALLNKLRASANKGRSGWDATDWMEDCQRGLSRHVAKGDPLDVAAYAAFCWHHGWSATPPTAAQDEAREEFMPFDAWKELVNKNDRTSPEDYPEMCLIEEAELADFMTRGRSPTPDEARERVIEHVEMARTRLRAALMGNEPCKPCIDLAQSYLDEAMAALSPLNPTRMQGGEDAQTHPLS